MKRSLPIVLFIFVTLYMSCDFQNPADFQVPKWKINLTIPLLDGEYGIAGIVNDSTIHSSGDSLLIKFDGTLPKDSVSGDFLKVPLNIDQTIADSVPAPSLEGAFSPITLTVSVPIPIGKYVLNGQYNNLSDPSNKILIPSSNEQKIIGADWNAAANKVETLAGSVDTNFNVIDIGSMFDQIPFIEKVLGAVIGGASNDNYFESNATNSDIPVPLSSTWSTILSGSDTVASHDTTNLQSGESFPKTSSLVGKLLGSELRLKYGFTLTRVADTDTVTIPGNSEVSMSISVTMKINDIDLARVIINEYSLAPEIPPFSFSTNQNPSEECQVRGVYSGQFEPNVSGSNMIALKNVSNSFPFDIDFGLDFRNFIKSNGDTVKFSQILRKNGSPYNEEADIGGGQFNNPIDPNSAVEEMALNIKATTVPDTVNVSLSSETSIWKFSAGIQFNPLQFSSLEADLGCPFPSQNQEMGDIPQGFTGMSFGEVLLKFTLYNEIRLPISLNLNLIGISSTGDSLQVLLDTKIARPVSTTDSAKTVVELSSFGTSVKLYNSALDTIADSSYVIQAGRGVNTIVDLLALNPADFIVKATAKIDGRGSIDVNKAIWGNYNLIAPFQVRIAPMTFIPNNSTVIDEWKHDTRVKLRNFVKEANLTSRVINGLPIGGNLSILFSNREIFPLDRSRKTLNALRDSLKWSISDSLYILSKCDSIMKLDSTIYVSSVIFDSSGCVDGTAYLVRGVPGKADTVLSYVDTMFTITLPRPKAYYTDASKERLPNSVMTSGDTTVMTGLDSLKMYLLTDLGKHFVRPRIHFSGTLDQVPDIVQFSMKDSLSMKGFMVLQLQSDGLLEKAADELILTYPNGGETISLGEEIKIKWRSLGSNLQSENVLVSTSTDDNPDISSEDLWSIISGGIIANVDSLNWTPSAVADKLWLKVCNESGSICDRSLSSFKVVSTNTISSGSNLFNNWKIKQKRVANGKR
ncbi:MAG: hypothetical protein CMG75_05495 [Candidatus Marinimicrobia bacterium]|nr:hypothetical protein [Candidatus Neomarinimicrobiota bacterium]